MATSASSTSNVLVTVRPSQSAFFAGETFSCTVTFANIAQPRPAPASSQLSPVYRQQVAVSPRAASIDITRPEPGSAPPRFDRGHRSALSLSEQSGLGLASRAQDEPAVVRPPSPQRPFPYDLGDGTTPASSTFPAPPLPQPRRPVPIAGSDPRRRSLPARRGLIGRPVPPLETSPSRGSRQGSASGGALRTRSIWGLDGLRSSSTPDLFAAAAGVPPRRTPPSTSRKGSRVMVPTAIEEEEAIPDPAAMPDPRPALMSRSLSAPSSPEMEKSGPSSPRTSPKAYRSSPLAPARPSGISVTAPTPDPDRFGVDGDDDEDDGARSPLDVSATSVISPSVSLSSLTTVPYTSPSPMHSYARSVSGANEFYGLGRAANETMESVLRDEVGRWAGGGTRRPSSYAHRRVSSLAHGAPPRTSSTGPPPSASASSETETLLWTFAKLEAHFEVDGRLIKPHEFLSVKRALFSGVGGGSGPGFGMVGGGTLGGAATSNGTAQKGGWRGWLFGSGGDPPAAADHAQPDAGSATVSMAQEGGAGEEEGMGGSLEARRARAMKDSAVPMFSTPPSVVAVDMKLAPGESKTYSFSIGIPADLPPSFKGRAIKFQYSFVVGTNRARSTGISGPAAKQVSRVMRVPVRVYNNVSVTGARPFYDLTNPIVYARDEATTVCTDDAPTPAASLARRASSYGSGSGGETELQAYAGRLLDALATASPDTSRQALSPSNSLRGAAFPAPDATDAERHGPSMRPEMRARHTSGLEHALPSRTAAGGAVDEDEEGGCKGAVEVVTRSAPKMSFDITKDGSIVAQLALIKSAYRLGESVDGVVVINSGGEGSGRVLRYSAQLETHELVETSIATRPAHQVQHATRRLHADHHEATLDTARSGFSLAIPSGASPDFSTSGVKLQWSVRLTLLFVPPSKHPVPITPRGPGGHVRTGSAAGGGAASAGAGLNASQHGRSKSYAYGFEPQVAVPPSSVPTGSPHLLPVPNDDGGALQTVYRGVPDLGYVPILYDAPDHGFSQQQRPSVGHQRSSSSLSSFGSQQGKASTQQAQVAAGNVVLIPAKVETVECSIPIRVYPGNTPFTPAVTTFFA